MSTVPLNRLETIALSVTRGVGSVPSVIIHTILFISAFALVLFGFDFDRVLLVLTTVLSLEAIYLSIFIQLSVNYQARAIASVEKDHDVEEIAEDVGEIAEDVEDIQEAHEEIQEDIEEIQKDVEEIQKDVDEIQEDVDEIQEDVEDIQEAQEEQPTNEPTTK
jgi:methyl-accepting chemotaxis protein